MIECKKCGRFIMANEGFCEKCGQKITKEDIENYQQKKLEKLEKNSKQDHIDDSDILLDKKSKSIINFFKVFNIILVCVNLLTIIIILFSTGELVNPIIKFFLFFSGIGYSILIYMFIEMIIKHFSNVSKIKEITYKRFMGNSKNSDI